MRIFFVHNDCPRSRFLPCALFSDGKPIRMPVGNDSSASRLLLSIEGYPWARSGRPMLYCSARAVTALELLCASCVSLGRAREATRLLRGLPAYCRSGTKNSSYRSSLYVALGKRYALQYYDVYSQVYGAAFRQKSSNAYFAPRSIAQQAHSPSGPRLFYTHATEGESQAREETGSLHGKHTAMWCTLVQRKECLRNDGGKKR